MVDDMTTPAPEPMPEPAPEPAPAPEPMPTDPTPVEAPPEPAPEPLPDAAPAEADPTADLAEGAYYALQVTGLPTAGLVGEITSLTDTQVGVRPKGWSTGETTVDRKDVYLAIAL